MKNKELFVDMGYDKEIMSQIKSKNEQIKKITEEIFELERKKDLTSSKYSEEYDVVKVKTGRKKTDFIEHKILKGTIKYQQGFTDEDTGEVVMIERNELVSINGVWCNSYGFAIKNSKPLVQTFYSDKKVWDEYPLKEETI